MPFVKELVIHGFKSFARETSIPFRNTMNVIIGPNGSGKSNVTDAICFVLGRLGSKSMRAKRLSNLIFAGTHQYKPAHEAGVELVFDNTDKGFSLNEQEVSIKRVLRKNGQGIYKINGEVKTRQEVLELLAQAGIDPNGFNIILQGEIDSFVKMPAEQRREIIEEVAGISVYEMRKQRSLAELEKTEQRLKETNAILRERTAYLKNLEEERKQAMHYKKLEDNIVIFKASIAHKLISEKKEKIEQINEAIQKEQDKVAKINSIIDKTQQEIAVLNDKISHITSNIQKATGLEQERLNSEISDLRAELAGLLTKKESFESQIQDMSKRREEIQISIENLEKEIKERSKSKGKSAKKELEIKKKQLEELDEQKRKFYALKSNLSSLNSRIEEKQRQLRRMKGDYDFTFNRIQQAEAEIIIKENLETHKEKTVILKNSIEKAKHEIEHLIKSKNNHEKDIAISESRIEEQEKIQSKVSSLDVCPLCKTKITPEHIKHVIDGTEKEKKENQEKIEIIGKQIKEVEDKIGKANQATKKSEEELRIRNQDILKIELINEKKETLKKFSEDIKNLEKENQELIKKQQSLENQLSSIKMSEANYDSLMLEVQELGRQEEEDLEMGIVVKQRDIERQRNFLKQLAREQEELTNYLAEVSEAIEEKQSSLEDKNSQDTMLKAKFKKILDEKNNYQEKIRFFETDVLHKQNDKHLCEEKMNNLKVERAQFLAQKETIEQDSKELKDVKIVRLPVEELRKKIEETQQVLARIGTVNLRALEMYDEVKKGYDEVQEKVNKIIQEKEEILKVIEDIDKKKKKAFMQTLEAINKLFSRNFSQLSNKGIASLEPTNPEDLFAGGLEMIIKVGKGKYFDTHSLSGGEQSLASLSLIFAIQEYKPYPFYIFDEIDAALDRHNSERLAALLKKYMNNGQYIIITHNDSLITEAPILYGVSMQDKISRVVSMEV